MVIYVPGTEETDPKKQNMSLQAIAGATNTAVTNIASNTTAITALQTPNYGLVNAAGALGVSLSKITACLGADVALNNTANYFDGPSVAQGSTGVWFASGTVSLISTSIDAIDCKLWDGTNVASATRVTIGGAGFSETVALSGFFTSPPGNIRISCKDISTTAGTIRFNATGTSKDSTISAYRIA